MSKEFTRMYCPVCNNRVFDAEGCGTTVNIKCYRCKSILQFSNMRLKLISKK